MRNRWIRIAAAAIFATAGLVWFSAPAGAAESGRVAVMESATAQNIAAGSWVRVRSLYGNKYQCLDGNGGTYDGYHHVIVNACDGRLSQCWYLRADGGMENGAYRGLCLDADVNGHFNGTRVQMWACNGTWQQYWYQLSNDVALYNKHFWFVNRPQLLLDRDINHAGDGAKVQMWEKNYKPQQHWVVELV